MDLQLRASEWGIGDDGMPMLIKPCGCRVPYRVWNGGSERDGFNFAEHTCSFGTSDEDLANLQHLRDRMLHEVREEDGEVVIEFTKLYRRKRRYLFDGHLGAFQEKAYRAVMELADRLEQELQLGPYNPLTVELMSNLAREHYEAVPPVALDHEFTGQRYADCRCDACEKTYQSRIYRELKDAQNAAAMSVSPGEPLPISINHDPLKRSYYIRLDTDGRHRTQEEMLRDVQAGLVEALDKHQQEFAAKLAPNY